MHRAAIRANGFCWGRKLLWLLTTWVAGAATLCGQVADPLPAAWRDDWERPRPEHRPLQIVHGIDLQRPQPEGVDQIVAGAIGQQQARAGIQRYVDHGLGGLVCNVHFQDYLTSEQNWQTLVAAVKACHDLGLVVWIYDEQGYPSGAAGGLVLQQHPEYEAQELAYDATRDDPFVVRAAYEFSHASNNYYAARRYINLIDDRAVRSFVQQTHQQYWTRLEPFFGNTIQAAFTDEPSLIAVNIGQIPEDARKRVPVVDPVDPSVPALPRVPWCYDLADRYQQHYGQDLLGQRRSLFMGDGEEDRRVRRQFWALVSELIAERYFGTLESWCDAHHIASSGHSLWEEAVLHHVPLEGNGLAVLSRMQIPGLDLLNSDPEAVIHSGWLTAALPASAAQLHGRRRVMTEVSDFSQKMGGQGPVGLAEMQATAAWQATWGVTEFTLYYGMSDRSQDDYRAYCDFVGRLNAVLRNAQRVTDVLLYYPIYDLWAEYLPVAQPLQLGSQSPTARQLVGSLMRLGQMLQRAQVPFTLVDHDHLASATVDEAGALVIGGQKYRTLILPQGVQLTASAAAVAEQLRSAGGRVLRDATDAATGAAEQLLPSLRPVVTLAETNPRLALGRFHRDGYEIVLVVNVGQEGCQSRLQMPPAERWLSLDPTTGAISSVTPDDAGRLPLTLGARQSRILVAGNSNKTQ